MTVLGHVPLTLVIPVYNEEKRLPPTLAILREWIQTSCFAVRIIIVDDGSVDSTTAVVESAIPTFPDLSLIKLNHVGYMNAIITGFKAAQTEYVASLEADCPVHPKMFEKFLQQMDKHDVVMGSRVSQHEDGVVEGKSLLRRVLSYGMSNMFAVLFCGHIRDPQIGFKLFKLTVLKKVLPELRLSHDGLKSAEILIKAMAFGFKIKELPVHYKHDEDSRCVPKGNYKVVVQAALALIHLWTQSYVEFKKGLLPKNPVRFGFLLAVCWPLIRHSADSQLHGVKKLTGVH